MKSILHCFICLVCLLTLVACGSTETPEPKTTAIPEEETFVDTLTVMEHLEANGALVAVTNNRLLNYRLYDGHPAGFHFELLDDFSDLLDLDLHLSVNDSIEECLHLLKNGEIDLFAGTFDSLTIDSCLTIIPIELPVETESTFAWIVLKHETDTSFLSAIRQWLDDFQGRPMRKAFYRYHEGSKPRRDSAFLCTNKICRYDNLIKAAAEKKGWDWRLLASIIYQESHFKPDLMSSRGAYGLMQLMPTTMEKYGVDYDSPVETQLEAGVKLLSHFNRELPESITDSLERVNFILASYNAGMGHVLKARQRAQKHGKDPDKWIDNVEFYASKQTYFFVREVTKRYSHYKNLIE